MDNVNALVQQLENLIQAVAANQQINGSDLRRVMRFISKVNQVVNQAFQNVYPILLEIKMLKEEDIGTKKIEKIEEELELMNARDYYRNVELICGQLRELQSQYERFISPIVASLDTDVQLEFSRIFQLLEDREDNIMYMVRQMTGQVSYQLHTLSNTQQLAELQATAARMADSIKDAISEMQLMNTKNSRPGRKPRKFF